MNFGEVQEWLNWLAWKAGVPQKGTEGSNPSLSAELNKMQIAASSLPFIQF